MSEADPATAADSARNHLVAALHDVARRDRAALRRVYDLTSAKLFGICLRISNDRAAAEDILQDVYIKIWNRAGRFDASRASPITWLCAIARNAAIDWQRASGRVATAPEDAALAIADERLRADESIEEMQETGRIHHCIDALDERAGTAIRAAFFDGLTYADLAERMNVPLGTMKSWIRRGLQRLKGCLEDG
ncbi:sigma-70 family RNA polymerase sigma factor [Sphingobium algorifonticola]|uniref:RNA polymerase sigma factor n=1 Tax=Sphingobium algorifonticola TaxID=2008318 RepID=A0A437J6P9_9SPHN|nr:sigma-70 family RNA polymerase sigma factor [Sphingobium algorifonticola]RVT40819.1 sigma-70 family RNA polymerase sigma factor [Sphingobium algorifonticola]